MLKIRTCYLNLASYEPELRCQYCVFGLKKEENALSLRSVTSVMALLLFICQECKFVAIWEDDDTLGNFWTGTSVGSTAKRCR